MPIEAGSFLSHRLNQYCQLGRPSVNQRKGRRKKKEEERKRDTAVSELCDKARQSISRHQEVRILLDISTATDFALLISACLFHSVYFIPLPTGLDGLLHSLSPRHYLSSRHNFSQFVTPTKFVFPTQSVTQCVTPPQFVTPTHLISPGNCAKATCRGQ